MKEIYTVKDLLGDEELMASIVEDLDDFDEEAEVTYAVWAIGYTADSCITDVDMFVGEFADPDRAVEVAKSLTVADIINKDSEEFYDSDPDTSVAYISIEVETVVADEDEGTMNVGTIYKRDLWLDDEPEDDEEIIHVKDSEYSIDEDGNLIISCAQFNHLNKNDIIKVQYDDEDNQPILTYKVMSKTTSGNFECKFMY